MDFIVRLIVRLPFGVIYALADVVAFIAWGIVRYRRRVVERNISSAFPKMTEQERRLTVRKFYRHLADYFFETIKLARISDSDMRRRMVFENPELIDSFIAQGRSVAVYFSHCFNWEWAPSVTLWSGFRNDPKVVFGQVYRPLKSEVFDRLFLRLRSRFGSMSIERRHVARRLLHMRREGIVSVTGFMSDQRVSHNDSSVTVDFLGRETPMILGTEQLAAKFRMAAVYWDIRRTGRGHYSITTRLLADHPEELPEGELTRRYTHALTDTIRRDPSNWLWSHKRWKNL